MTSIVRNAKAASALVVAVFAIVLGSSVLAMLSIVGGKDAAIRDAEALRTSTALLGSHHEKLAAARGYVLAHDSQAFQEYAEADRAVHRGLRQLRRRGDSVTWRALLDTAERAEAAYDKHFADLVASTEAMVGSRVTTWKDALRPTEVELLEALEAIVAHDKATADASNARARRQEGRALALLGVITAGVLLLGGLATRAIGRSAARALSAEQRTREAAEEARGFLASLLDQLPLGVVVAEAPSGTIVHVSDGARALLGAETGWTPGELPLARAVRGEIVHAERSSSPTGRVFESHAAPIRDRTNEVVAAIVAFSEVTDKQRAEAERERFLDVLAHDLRNPISAILMSAGTLVAQGGLPERAQRAAARMQSSAQRMGRLIEQLLDFARSRSGRMTLELRRVDLEDVIRDVVADLELGSPTSHVVVEIDRRSKGLWDRDRLSQVFHNVIGNAIAYSDGGAPVVVRVTHDGASTEVSVTNRGPTIPEDVLAVLFEPFRRGGQSKGLGLGLFIARTIVEAHGGVIEVTSANGETTFVIRIPCEARATAMPAGGVAHVR